MGPSRWRASRDAADPTASKPKRTRRVRFLAAPADALNSSLRCSASLVAFLRRATGCLPRCDHCRCFGETRRLPWCAASSSPMYTRIDAPRARTCTRAYIRYEATMPCPSTERRGYFFRFRSPGCRRTALLASESATMTTTAVAAAAEAMAARIAWTLIKYEREFLIFTRYKPLSAVR